VYLDEAHAKRLVRIAREEGRSQAEVLRRAIDAYDPEPTRDRDFAGRGVRAHRRRPPPDLADPRGGAAGGLRRLTLLIDSALLEGFGA
jgi:hypothetical protein